MFGILLFYLAVLHVSFSASCPQLCRCDNKRKIVFCNERNLVRVPFGIPLDTKILLLQGNAIENSPSLESILSDLTQLEKLDMHENRLTSFPNQLPSRLTFLSLRLNVIKFIGRNALKNLPNLKELHLDSNNITNRGLGANAFAPATSLEDLTLSNNALSEFPEGLPSSLRSLRLDHNQITAITTVAFNTIENLQNLDLSYNNIVNELFGLEMLKKLQSLDLNHNQLVNLPPNLPNNLTELLLSANNIQYIYTSRGPNHGDLQELRKLRKLDLSSNRLRSIEKGSLAALPTPLSMELHSNPWGCDCNLVYLKQWLTYTTSILASSASGIKCATPLIFSGVMLEAIDVEALKCVHSQYKLNIESTMATNTIVEYSISSNQEPPYVTFSLMYGIMLCEDCTLAGSLTSDSHSVARNWMKDYTIVPLVPGVPMELSGLLPDTRYAVCVVTSYQHPDQIGIEQCEDVRTLAAPAVLPSPTSSVHLPLWLQLVIVACISSLLVGFLVLGIVWFRKRRRRTSRRTFVPSHQRRPGSTTYTPGRGPPLVDANPEFDVTLMVRQDLKRQSDSCYSGSRDDESLNTAQTETIRSGNESNLSPAFVEQDSNHYEHLTTNFNTEDTNNGYECVKLHSCSDSGLYV